MTDPFETEAPALWAEAYRVAYRILGRRGDAEDAAQDALARLLVRWDTITPASRSGWVARTAANLAVDELRRRTRRKRLTDRSPNPALHDDVFGDERVHLAAILRSLPRRQREVVVLRYLADLTEVDVAATLGISVGAVKQHAHRGLAALRPLAGDEPAPTVAVPRRV